MPEDRYVLLVGDARFLPCWPVEPPPRSISLALTASLAKAQEFYFYMIREGDLLADDQAFAERFA
jgi:hypothetical protein